MAFFKGAASNQPAALYVGLVSQASHRLSLRCFLKAAGLKGSQLRAQSLSRFRSKATAVPIAEIV